MAPVIRFRGLSRGRVRGATLVLNGADPIEFRRAARLAGSMFDRGLLVAVDGGLSTCRGAGKTPDLYVGDGDSVRSLPAAIPCVVYPRDKDFSDMSGALRELRKRKVRAVAVAGLLGGRLDHEWANVLELGRWAGDFAGFVAPTGRGRVVVTARGFQAGTTANQALSLFALNGTATVTLRGTRWTLERRRVRPGSLGLSNRTRGKLDLTVHAGTAAVVFLPRG